MCWKKPRSSPSQLCVYALEQVAHAVVDGKGPLMLGGALVPGLIAKAEVELLRRILHAHGGDGNIAITRAEAEVLFRINERTAQAKNDPSWNDLFVKAIANFVMCSAGYEAADPRCGAAPGDLPRTCRSGNRRLLQPHGLRWPRRYHGGLPFPG